MSQVSRSRTVVTGMGVLSSLGDSPAALHQALCEGRHGRRRIERFEVDGLRVVEAGEMDFKARDYLPEGNLRPLDRTGQLVASAAQLALDASGWDAESRQEHGLGLVLGTMYGSVHTIAAFDQRALEAGPQYVKPFDFANSVINAAAGQTAIWHHLWGLNSTLTGGPSAGAEAIGYASDKIRGGGAATVLAGGGEELCYESFFSAERAGLLAGGDGDEDGNGACAVPFDARRSGMSLSEGAALLVLEEASAAAARGATVQGEILGHATVFDPSRGQDAALADEVLRRAVTQALDDAEIRPGQVCAISASANGSPAGDLREARVLAAVFGDDLPPICAVKGGLGESLGASAPMQAVVLLESLRQGRLPGVVGLQEIDDAMPLRNLSASPADLSRTGPALLLASGLDGNVCVLVLGPA